MTEYSRSSPCPNPELKHGRVRGRPGARIARFLCNPHYELVGNKYANCRFGEWDVPLPVCVRAGCNDIELENGISFPTHRGAWLVFYCFPGYKLVGSSAAYCDGYRWNATTPKCVPEKGMEPQLSCDFESEGLCGWRQDDLHDFDWSRLNTKTPSAFLYTGPSYDHTLGKGQSGYYMFIESTSRLTNESARLISPIYDGKLAKNGCFSFFYHMYGKSIGGLRVYQIPEGLHQLHGNLSWSDKQDYLLFEKWGEHGDFWFRNVSKLNDTAANFQIVIEGIRGHSFTSDIAIDDVAILQGAECEEAISTAVTPPEFRNYLFLQTSHHHLSIAQLGRRYVPLLNLRRSSHAGTVRIGNINTIELALITFLQCGLVPKPFRGIASETCAGRCDIFGKSAAPAGRVCACSAACVTDDNCCPDFYEICVFDYGRHRLSRQICDRQPHLRPTSDRKTHTNTVNSTNNKHHYFNNTTTNNNFNINNFNNNINNFNNNNYYSQTILSTSTNYSHNFNINKKYTFNYNYNYDH
ncbi:hypothetical protein MSG28_011403 [Choristoneura fumiferana]|uniref:Uncharacterized protein n=1 Tax=Choristoneura fumiferana TaxID=7141 RepID=A0ACC0JN42_CHOFU|nr:hypothetical protein MSG28_011403 [Choristoneura fumiferana]